MLINILKKDLIKNKAITAALFIFMMLSALLVASGANTITELINSMNALFTKSDAPHFVQMHSGDIDQAEIDEFAKNNSLVKNRQTVEMVLIDGLDMDFGKGHMVEKNSMMDHYFVKQNDSFDFLLNMNSDIINVSPGEIAVPIYYKQQENLELGDKVKISSKAISMEFTVVDFVRDVQMNPSIIHSKRFVVSEADAEMLKGNVGTVEYLIEFQLNDLNKLREFRNAYESANLPKSGPDLDYHLFKTLNSITDGVVAAVIILVSVLLSIIAVLCLRFTILAAIEEDFKEIGVMKAIGIRLGEIKKIYLIKYVVLGALASAAGYVASFFLNRLFTRNIMIYMGSAEKSILLRFIPFLAVIFIFIVVILFCMLTLRRLNKITAVEALKSGNLSDTQRHTRLMALNKNKLLNIHVLVGLNDMFQRFKMYRLLFLVFIICAFIIIVPINFLTTIQSPEFINYMGVERSDIRIDLQQSDHADQEFKKIITHLESDQDVDKFSPSVTSQFKVMNNEGVLENITVESGDFSIFPLEYLRGGAPVQYNEIAISYLNGKDLEKDVGDKLLFIINGKEKEMTVSGIYQDVTNGGRTAKARLPFNQDTILRYKVNVDVKPQVDISEKMKTYGDAFHPAKVNDVKGYLTQTFENTIEQLRLFTTTAIVIALFVAILITSLFLKMLVAKDRSQIAIMKSIGFSVQDIQIQYITKTLGVLVVGITLGTILSNTIGQSLVSALLSFMGASRIEFVVDPVKAYMLCPVILMIVVAVTTLMSIMSIKKTSMDDINS